MQILKDNGIKYTFYYLGVKESYFLALLNNKTNPYTLTLLFKLNVQYFGSLVL